MANHVAFENWTPELVVQWLRGLDDAIQPYVQFFLNNGIDGRKLMMLAHSDLERMNVLKLGHQELILEAVDLLRVLRYGYESENLQFLALQLGCKARSLHNEIQAQTAENDKNKANMTLHEQNRKRLSINNLSSVANLLTALKNLVSWLDRSPFEGTHELCLRRNTIVKTGLDLVTASQKEANIFDIEDAIMKTCTRLAGVCDELVIESRDPMFVQPASLEVASIRKKPGEELGMHIQSSYYGIHQIGGIKDMSPAELCGKIEKGDEVIQVNGQTVVGWQLKTLVNALKEKPKEVILLLKKRPHHTSPFGQMQKKKKQINKAQVATLPKSLKKRRSREEQKQNRPMLQDLMNKTPSSEEPNSPKETTDGNDTDNDVFRSGSESPQYTLPVQVDPKQRRATVSGGSPTLSRPLLVTEELDTPTRPKSFAVASMDAPHAYINITPPEEKGKEFRLGDKLKNTTATERRQEFKATKSAPQTLEFTVKKPIPKVQEPGQENNSSESEQLKKNSDNTDRVDKILGQSNDLKTDTKDITFKVSIEHSDAGEMQTQSVPVSSESSAFKTVPQIIEMSPQNEEKAGIPITPEIQIHIHDAGISPDDPQLEIETLQTATVISSTADENSTPHVTKHSVHVQAQLLEIAPSDSPESTPEISEDKHLLISSHESSEDKQLCYSLQDSSEDKRLCTFPDNTSLESSKQSECSTTSAESLNTSLLSASSVDRSQSPDTMQEITSPSVSPTSVIRISKPGNDLAGTTNDKNAPQLLRFRKISSKEPTDMEVKLDEKNSAAQFKKVAFVEPIKKNPEEEKVISYKYIVVAGQVQKIADDGTSQVSPVLRRQKLTKRVDRRVSCKDLGQCDCEGWLLKHKGKTVGPLSKQWQKRWCVLKNSNFFYYKNKMDLKADGVIHLPAFQVSPAPEIKSKRKIAFKVHNPGTSFYFASERQDDMSKWMNKMGLAAITYSDKDIVTTGGFQKPGNRIQRSENDYYSESEDEDDDSSQEKQSLSSSKSMSPASLRSEKAGSPISMRSKTRSPSLCSPASVHSSKISLNLKVEKIADVAAGSTDDLTVLYRNIQRENLTLMGRDRRTAISTNLDIEKSPEQITKVLKLTSLQRTLKAKENELHDIQHLLSSKLTPSKLTEFTECHVIPGSSHNSRSPQSSDTDTL